MARSPETTRDYPRLPEITRDYPRLGDESDDEIDRLARGTASTVCSIQRYIFGLSVSLLKNDVKRPLAASTRRAPGRSPLRRAARARVARASDRHRSPLSTLCPRTADAQARGRARAVALRTPPSTRARSRTSPVTLSSE